MHSPACKQKPSVELLGATHRTSAYILQWKCMESVRKGTSSYTEDFCIYSCLKVYETSKEVNQDLHRELLHILLMESVWNHGVSHWVTAVLHLSNHHPELLGICLRPQGSGPNWGEHGLSHHSSSLTYWEQNLSKTYVLYRKRENS